MDLTFRFASKSAPKSALDLLHFNKDDNKDDKKDDGQEKRVSGEFQAKTPTADHPPRHPELEFGEFVSTFHDALRTSSASNKALVDCKDGDSKDGDNKKKGGTHRISNMPTSHTINVPKREPKADR
jgi:hypothetical protein